MIIGKYVIRRSKTIKDILIDRESANKEHTTRMLQIYSCRIFGLCFYRADPVYCEERKEIFKRKPKI